MNNQTMFCVRQFYTLYDLTLPGINMCLTSTHPCGSMLFLRMKHSSPDLIKSEKESSKDVVHVLLHRKMI